MIDTLIENIIQNIGERYFGKKRKLKGPKIHVNNNGSMHINSGDLFRSESGRAAFQKMYNSKFHQELLKKQGHKPGLIDLMTDEEKRKQYEWEARKERRENKK